MQNVKTEQLIKAIQLLDKDAVVELMKSGANPYEKNAEGVNALSTWIESQDLGNPYTIAMGRALLSNPEQASKSELLRLGDIAVKRVATALGVADQATAMGIHPDVAYLPPQPLEDAQGTWSLVRHALDKVYDENPTTMVSEYANAFALGRAKARALLQPGPGGTATLLPGNGPEVADPQEARAIANAIGNMLGDTPLTVLPKGEVAQTTLANGPLGFFVQADPQQPGSFKTVGSEQHFASIYRGSFEQAMEDAKIGGQLMGIPHSSLQVHTNASRLSEALHARDWERAQTLVDKGTDIKSLVRGGDFDPAWLGNAQTLEETTQLLKLGADPWKAAVRYGTGFDGQDSSQEKVMPIQIAKTQEQFDLLLDKMKEAKPDMATFVPENARVEDFWRNSPHFVDTRSFGNKMAENILNVTVKPVLSLLLKDRRPEEATNKNTGPKVG